MMPRVVHFDIYSDDPQRAIDFYGGVFGWKFEKWQGPMDYWLVTTGTAEEPGIDGGMGVRGQGGLSLNAFRSTVAVPDADDYATNMKERGGRVVMEKTAVPGVGWFVACVDTEGSHFNLRQADESAG